MTDPGPAGSWGEPAPGDAQGLVDFLTNEQWDLLLDDVNRRIEGMEQLADAGLKQQVFALLQGVDAIHREALRRLVRLFKDGVLEKVVSDPAIHTLMDLYDLLPADMQAPEPDAPKPRFPTIPIKAVPSGAAPRARYPHWVPVASLAQDESSDLVHQVEVDGTPVLLVRQARQVFAMSAFCVQDGSSLRGATVSAYTLACPNHGGCYYDVRQGKRMGHNDGLTCFPVRQDEDGKLQVGQDMDFSPNLPSF